MLTGKLFAAFAVASLTAGQAPVQPLPAGAKAGASLAGITEYTFPNGLRALLFPDPSNPKVTVNVTCLVGSRHEGYGETGMAHLLEHLLFLRTTGGRDIKKELTSHGASWNGSTSYDRTNYFETVAASEDNLRWALSLEADRLVNAVLHKSLLDTEMTVVRNEFERGENNPARVLEERVVATAYLWHNYGKSTIGARADIENVPIDRLEAFYRKYYQPDNVVLVVAGRVNEARTLGLIGETVGRIPRPARRLDPTWTTEPTQDGERYVALRRVGESQAVMAAYHAPAAAHPDSSVLEVLAAVMSGGGGYRGGGGVASGRLNKALVDTQKAVSARMSSEQLHDPGYVMAAAELSKDQSLAEARRVLLQTVEGLPSEPPTRQEVERAKTRLLRAIEMQMADSQRLGLGLSEWAAMGDWRLFFLNRDRIRQVTPEDVVRVARTYFVESNRTVGEFIPTPAPLRAEIPAAPDLVTLFQDYRTTGTLAQGEAFDPTPAKIEERVERTRLANGMKVALLARGTRGGTVSAVVLLHFGDGESLAGQSAAAQVGGGLLMRGTRNRTRDQLQDEMDRLQARIVVAGGGGGGGAGGRRGPVVASDVASAVAVISTTEKNLPGALALAVEMLREPAFAESDFEQVRRQRIAALEAGRSEPAVLATDEARRRLSPWKPGDAFYMGTIGEQIEELKKVALDDVKKFHARFYGAGAGELAVVGQFDKAALLQAAAGSLGGWNSAAPYRPVTTPYRKAEPVSLKIETPDKQNAQFEAGMRIRLADEDADYPAMILANEMFGGSLGARMPNRIRNVEGLSYGVSSRLSLPVLGNGALFSAAAISAPQNTAKVEASFLDELRRTLDGGFTAQEVATAKKAYLDERAVARSQEQGLALALAARDYKGRTMKWDDQLEAKIQALTVEEINAAIRRHLDPSALVIVKAGDFR